VSSFFCLTVDLYGEERLMRLNDRLRKRFRLTRARLVDSNAPEWLNLIVVSGCTLFFSALACLFWWLIFRIPITPSDGWAMILGIALAELLYAMLAAITSILTLLGLFYLGSTLGLLLLRKVNVRGSLLLFGTLLFLVSKGLSVAKLLAEFRK